MHDQFKIRIETENANKLAQEIREVYCQLSTLKKNQAVILSQTNGILAASAIGLPTCSRIQGLGQTMLLQQCTVKTVVLTAIETQCGFQPFFTYASENYTLGMDGWSIHPYSPCFWKTHFVNINGNAFAWEHNATSGEWVKQNPTVHTANLDLIAEFEELQLNDFDLALKAHPAHNVMEMEQLNILNDLVGQLHETESKAMSNIVVTREQDNNIGTMFSWFDTLKIMGLSTIGFILFLISIRLFVACNIIPKITKISHRIQNSTIFKRKTEENTTVELERMLNSNPEVAYNQPAVDEPTFVRKYAPPPLQASNINKIAIQKFDSNRPSAPSASQLQTKQSEGTNIIRSATNADKKINTQKCAGPHTSCTYITGYGMVWEDLCRCDENNATE
jgi:hypothetical protein